jgi:hypothetical protein
MAMSACLSVTSITSVETMLNAATATISVRKVSAAVFAHYFGPSHVVGVVFSRLHRGFVERFEEARPPAARLEFGLRREKRVVADNAPVDAVVVTVPVLPRERTFRTLFLGDVVLLGGEL